MLKWEFIIAAVLVASVIGKAAAAPAPTNTSNYCLTGTAALMVDDTDAVLQKVYDSCKPGDTIGIAAGGNGSVGVQRLCDFTKAITQASRLTVCVLAPLRPTR